MTHLYSVQGTGKLIVKDEDLGEVNYKISVFQARGLKDVNGTLYADWKVLHKALEAKGADLILETGQRLEVLVKSIRVGEDAAPIHVNGIPDP